MSCFFPRWVVAVMTVVALCGAALLRNDTPRSPNPAGPTGAVLGGELKYASQRADLCGAGNAVGVGLRAEYFSELNFAGSLLLTRIDRTVDFDSGFELPTEYINRVRSIRWTGWIKPPLAGDYQFHVAGPGMRVKVGQQWVAGAPSGAGHDAGAPPQIPTAMSLGRFYPIIVELPASQIPFAGRWRLEWTAPHGMRFVVPTALLFGPTG